MGESDRSIAAIPSQEHGKRERRSGETLPTVGVVQMHHGDFWRNCELPAAAESLYPLFTAAVGATIKEAQSRPAYRREAVLRRTGT